MNRLKETTLARLRDMLREQGQRPSLRPDLGNLPKNAAELLKLNREYGALCEAMYLMMAADDRVLNVEREVLKGAMRSLTDGSVKSVYIEAMVDTAAKRLAADGREARLEVVITSLQEDSIKAEVAFVLAAAIAVADGELHSKEKAMLTTLSIGLSIEDHKVESVLKELEAERAQD